MFATHHKDLSKPPKGDLRILSTQEDIEMNEDTSWIHDEIIQLVDMAGFKGSVDMDGVINYDIYYYAEPEIELNFNGVSK